MKILSVTASSLIIVALCFSAAASANKKELCQPEDLRCTFVLVSENDNKSTIINETRSNKALTPFSTFKIPNSIIGLETGLIKDSEQVLTYDKNKYPSQAWWPSVWKLEQYNLASALKFSMVAVYRQLASDIGKQRMQNYLHEWQYGNQDISSGLDSFWLNGSIKISAVEQVKFLQSFYHNKLSLKPSTLATMKEIMLVEKGENYKMYAKTGAGKVDDGSMLGWYVGFVENQNGVHYFALNFNRPSYGEMKALRTTLVHNHLTELGIL